MRFKERSRCVLGTEPILCVYHATGGNPFRPCGKDMAPRPISEAGLTEQQKIAIKLREASWTAVDMAERNFLLAFGWTEQKDHSWTPPNNPHFRGRNRKKSEAVTSQMAYLLSREHGSVSDLG